jgi:lipoprotein-anchoring transpeptidase ErfK/SrfK
VWKKLLISAIAVIVVLGGAGAVALHQYDAARADLIAAGITVAGIEVGGMSDEQAHALLRQRIVGPLEEPLTLTYEKRRFVLAPALVDVRADVDALVRAALAESRDGNFLARSFRDLTGRRLRTEIPLRVDYSEEALGNVVQGIKRAVDRSARNAKSQVSLEGVRIIPSRTGVAVQARGLRGAIIEGLIRPDAHRLLAVPVKRLVPRITTKRLASKYRYFIAISRGGRELRLFVDLDLAKTYPIGIGQIGFETPAGEYEIKTKAANPAWYVPNKPWAGDLAGKVIAPNDPTNPIKARWMGFYQGAGIHGTADTASIGTAASHGCIRMTVPDVIDLYDRVPLHTRLYIA